VTPDTRLVSLATVSPQRAAFQVPERYADLLRVGQRVTFRVAVLPGREFIGKVDFVDPTVQLPGRTITVEGQVPQAGAAGGHVHRGSAGHRGVSRRQVELGVRAPGFVEVKSGVDAGETVVVGGQERLGEGVPVAPKLLQRTPARGGKESASVGAR
jgi:membrane fusion protein (multidrug efflux system)